jgi:dTDP-4-dehydrorhamnose reductase
LDTDRTKMSMAVTGKEGQVAHALREIGPMHDIEVVPLARPAFDLLRTEPIRDSLLAVKPAVVVNAAAYTAVDQAEKEPDLAMQINGIGAGAVAEAAHSLNIPIIQLSTDYVFDGTKSTPYVGEDQPAPLNAYGASKLAGERAVASATHNHVILRASWVYSHTGRNFVRTMLRLARERNELRVVADQYGCPTYAPDIALAIMKIPRSLVEKPGANDLRRLFHLCGSGETTWAAFASEIFAMAAEGRDKRIAVIPIPTADYPTPARRSANSRLDTGKLARIYQIRLPDWRVSHSTCLGRLREETGHE